MNRTLALLLSISVCASLAAATVDEAALKIYATNSLPRCADSQVSLQRVDEASPTGFVKFKLTQTSSDQTCGRSTYLLYSPSTQQVLIGTIVPLPYDARPIDARVSQAVSERLNTPVNAQMSKSFPLPDALKPVTMIKATQHGPFAYHGYVDASEQFLIVGYRGNLKTDPGISFADAINLPATAVRRGNPKAKTTIIELSDFECPSCGRSHKVIEPIIAKHLDKVDYYRVDLPLFEMHPWALDAAAGARAISKVAPKKYWDYTNYIYAHQEDIGEKVPFETIFKHWVEDNDIKWPAVERIYRDASVRASIVDQVSRILDMGINSTPTYIINGRIIGYGPEGKMTLSEVKKAVGEK